MGTFSVLVVDDEKNIRHDAARLPRGEGRR